MSQRLDDYPKGSNVFLKFIITEGLEDVCVSGSGTIDGQGGEPWWDEFLKLGAEKREKEFARPQAIYVSKCRRVALEHFSSVNPPNSHCSFRDCRDLTFRGLTMTAPDESSYPRSRPFFSRRRRPALKPLVSREHVADASDTAICTTPDGEPLHAEPTHDATMHLLGERAAVGLLPSRGKSAAPTTAFRLSPP